MSPLFTKQLVSLCLLPVLMFNGIQKSGQYAEETTGGSTQKPITIDIDTWLIQTDSSIYFRVKISSKENIVRFVWKNNRGGTGQPGIKSDNLKEIELPLTIKMAPGDNIIRFTVTDIRHNTVSVSSRIFNYSMVGTPVVIRGQIEPVKLIPSQVVQWVKIGTAFWTVKNMSVSKYNNGDIIPEVTDPNTWSSLTSGAWCHYNNDPANDAVYGKLYNWYAINDPRGLAEPGWHVPDRTEWLNLISALGDYMVAGGKLKESGVNYWKLPNTAANNSTGFTALPGGARKYDGGFTSMGLNGGWWSSSSTDAQSAFSIFLTYDYGLIEYADADKAIGYSVRCINN